VKGHALAPPQEQGVLAGMRQVEQPGV